MFEKPDDFSYQDQSCNMFHYLRHEELAVSRLAVYRYYTYVNRLLLESSNHQ